MPDLKLARLPDRTPVKITISVSPNLAATLKAYSEAYREAYGQEEAVSDLIPVMLVSFLESDRAFARRRRDATE
ncbi:MULTISPECIES: DUF2274 domain-containing protein [unclassified Sphingomonas]|uniref:DUF2274 domain-containing protein n=1 Tax=unclassified Sphingomonas TaxID=196159 RepID=UPI0006FDE8B3|nr:MULTISPECIES: DUF2274 domain-containing protein [unclassified Sphingomonas]KQY65395.1 transposase [Sphingomonas sp. Root50]KRB95310.1 transposase [Sphingomonas sp. Root720]